MKIPVFLSYSNPINKKQRKFLKRVKKQLKDRGFDPRTLGSTDYDMDAPLAGCRRLMLECNGLICVAFRRHKIEKGLCGNGKEDSLDGKWTTSAFCQIEPAMAYQLGLPILIFQEKDVISEGVLEKDVVGQYMPDFNLDDKEERTSYFDNAEFKELLFKWGYRVQTVWHKKGDINRYQ